MTARVACRTNSVYNILGVNPADRLDRFRVSIWFMSGPLSPSCNSERNERRVVGRRRRVCALPPMDVSATIFTLSDGGESCAGILVVCYFPRSENRATRSEPNSVHCRPTFEVPKKITTTTTTTKTRTVSVRRSWRSFFRRGDEHATQSTRAIPYRTGGVGRDDSL